MISEEADSQQSMPEARTSRAYHKRQKSSGKKFFNLLSGKSENVTYKSPGVSPPMTGFNFEGLEERKPKLKKRRNW